METNAPVVKKSKFDTRIHEIDFFRGLLIIVVIIDHVFSLLMTYNKGWMNTYPGNHFYENVYNFANWYWHTPIRDVVRPICLTAFCFISGISCAFSKNNLKRAVKMVVFWAIIFIGSNILELIYIKSGVYLGLKSVRIDFNIIGVLAFSNLIYAFVEKKNWKWLLAIIIAGLLIHITVVIIQRNWSGLNDLYFPFFWEPSKEVAMQADYMPLVPYISFFFAGALLTHFTYSKYRKSYFNKFEFERPFCFLGRHTLIIYVTHMIILVGIFAFIDLFI